MDEKLYRRDDGRQSASVKTKRLVGMALFSSIIVVLQVFATFVKFGPFSITLTLIPMVVGSAVYGKKAGAVLGGVFGAVVLIMCIVGADLGGAVLWNASPVLTALLCLFKGVASGWCAGLVYGAISGNVKLLGFPLDEVRPEALSQKIIRIRRYVGVILAALVCPIVNTGIFCAGMALFFRDILTVWAGGTELVYYVIVGLVGVNFILETCINIVLSPVISRLIGIGKKK